MVFRPKASSQSQLKEASPLGKRGLPWWQQEGVEVQPSDQLHASAELMNTGILGKA
jgi:hypothetical protein